MPLASASASSSVSNGVIATTGPKISSWKIRASGGDVGEHGRGDVVAGREAVRPAAAGDEPALGLADLDVATSPCRSAPGAPARRPRSSGSCGSPTTMCFARAAYRSHELVVDRRARPGSGDPAVQRSPLSEKTPKSVESIAASRSASANTTRGDLPPSSIDRPLRYGGGVARRSVCPVRLSPVKEISGTSGCLTRASPASSPRPLTRLKTPSGSAGLLEDRRPTATPTAG